MAVENHIRNPIEWGLDQLKAGFQAMGRAGHTATHPQAIRHATLPTICRIQVADLWDALAKGVKDLGANRTDVIFLCIIYPIAGLVLARVASGYDMLPLVFPLMSGFALIGPLAGVGLYEMSRRREEGLGVNWASAFAVIRSPALGSIVALGVVLLALFALWLGAAWLIYIATLGPEPPTSLGSFFSDVFTTGAGWAMIVVGMGVGFLFAVVVLAISVVSFPLLLDRNVGVYAAVATSVRAVKANPVPMAVWGVVVAGSLVLGSIPALLGLIIVLPLLGHATWHLYRKVVPR